MFLQNIQKGSREENQRSVWESDALINVTAYTEKCSV